MSTATIVGLIVGCALANALVKGAAPLILGARPLPGPVTAVVPLLTAPLLTGLVVTQTVAEGQRLQVGAAAAGVLVAAVLAWRRVPALLCVLAAAVVAAVLRQIT